MKKINNIVAMAIAICLIVGLSACGTTGGTSQSTGTNATQSSGNGKSGSTQSNAKKEKQQESEKKTVMPDWTTVYHCASEDQIMNDSELDVGIQASVGSDDDSCVVISQDQTASLPIVEHKFVDDKLVEGDTLLGELPITFDSTDVGSWDITADASKLKIASLVEIQDTFTLQYATCNGGECSQYQDEQAKLGEKTTIHVTGGTTVILNVFIAGAYTISVIRE